MLKEIEVLLERKFGLTSDKSTRKKLLEYLNKRAKELKLSFTDFLSLLESGDSVEWNKLVEELTINESYFFRIPSHFELLKEISIDILSKRGKLSILSAGCCTGEEPYTIAIILKENIPPDKLKNIYILGTDVNKKNLSLAKKGIYSKRKVAYCSSEIRKKYFAKVGNRFRLSDEIKVMCDFKYQNLLDFSYFNFFGRKFDIIFFRNVMIYFNKEVNREILNEMSKILHDDGYLFTGASESLWGITDIFRAEYFKDTFYYKKAEKIKSLPAAKLIVKNDETLNEVEDDLYDKSFSIENEDVISGKENFKSYLVELLNEDKLTEFEKGLEEFEKNDFLDKDIIFLKGIYFFKREDFQLAIKEFKKLTFLDIDLITPRIFLSICYKKIGRDFESQKELENFKDIFREGRGKRLDVENTINEVKEIDFEKMLLLISDNKNSVRK